MFFFSRRKNFEKETIKKIFFQLKIKYGKNSIAILTEPNETVRDLKAKINLATDAPQQSQKLIFRGRSISFLLWRINFCFPARCLYLIQSIERR